MPYIKGRKTWYEVQQRGGTATALGWISLCPYDRFTEERDQWIAGYWDKVDSTADKSWEDAAC
jgi:ribosome modulation factor